ncbi:MAG: anion transporter [Nitrososphaerota archaeon]|nr:anion transporter [Nitrososphaerota archaeon]
MIFFALGIFLLTYTLLIFRKFRGRIFPIWASMIIGAALMLATLTISPVEAFRAIDFPVLAFLFGLLVINAGFEKSGLLEYIVISLLSRAKNVDRLVLGLVFGSGLLSAFLVNDGIALLLTPLALSISTKLKLVPKSLLIPVAFGITTGSAFTPIGNPQNLLVALNSGMPSPFSQFILYLLVPSLVSLLLIYYLSKLFFRKDYEVVQDYQKTAESLPDKSNAITDRGLAKLSAVILLLMLATFVSVEIFPILQSLGLTLGNIALSFGMLMLISSPRRLQLLLGMNWGILVFFAGMFVVMRAVWDSSIGSILLSHLPIPHAASRVESTYSIMTNSVLLSQVLSNVPFVQLYTYEMHALSFTSSSTIPWLTLAAGSTLAGNLTLLGAVSNVIILDSAEQRKQKAFSFVEFVKYGVVATALTCAVFFLFLAFV